MDKLNIDEILKRNTIKQQIKDFIKHFNENKKDLSINRGIYLYGLSGIGKTSFIKNIIIELNYDMIYYDASNIRNKNIIEDIANYNISDTNVLSLLKKEKKNIIIVMDEVDGMNNGDKGGINNLIKLIRPKKTKKQKAENYTMNPIICISNEHIDKKISELKKVCINIELKKPTDLQMNSLLKKSIKNIDKKKFDNLLTYINCDLRKFEFIYNLYKQNNFLFENDIFYDIIQLKTTNDSTKQITQKLLSNEYPINSHNIIINDNDRTSISLLFHENIIELLHNIDINNSITFYQKILNNICFSDYIDRITFQKQLWIFNEMSSLIKTFYNHKILHNEIENKKVPSTIRFTKVLTKYSTEYNNSLFINNLCQKTNMDKKDMILLFKYLKETESITNIYEKFENYELTKLDINRMYRFLDSQTDL